MNDEIDYWMRNENGAKTTMYREFCCKMQQMYFERYEYYLRKKSFSAYGNGDRRAGTQYR